MNDLVKRLHDEGLHAAPSARRALGDARVAIEELRGGLEHAIHLLWVHCEGLAPHIEMLEATLAAATGTAKTPTAVECEASQSGPTGNAQILSRSSHDPRD